MYYSLRFIGFLMLISEELENKITFVHASDSSYRMMMSDIDLPL